MKRLNISLKEYIAVLEAEVETLSGYYANAQKQGACDFQKAIDALNYRIQDLKKNAKDTADLAML